MLGEEGKGAAEGQREGMKLLSHPALLPLCPQLRAGRVGPTSAREEPRGRAQHQRGVLGPSVPRGNPLSHTFLWTAVHSHSYPLTS